MNTSIFTMRTFTKPTAFAAIFFFAFFGMAHAAELSVEMAHDSVPPQSEFIATVFVDAKGEAVNAFEGALVFPADQLAVKEIRDGSSVVTVWIQKPEAKEAGRITFSGITPGGYAGKRGAVFSVVFVASREGMGALALQNIQVLKNDGAGTPASVETVSANFHISKTATADVFESKDVTPPEPFSIQIAEDPSAFDGKKFLVFDTHDKGQGIAYFEVCEGIFSACVRAGSPYELKNQKADVLIGVHAVDGAGNKRTEYLCTPGALIRYALYIFLAILGIVSALFAFRRVRTASLQ